MFQEFFLWKLSMMRYARQVDQLFSSQHTFILVQHTEDNSDQTAGRVRISNSATKCNKMENTDIIPNSNVNTFKAFKNKHFNNEQTKYHQTGEILHSSKFQWQVALVNCNCSFKGGNQSIRWRWFSPHTQHLIKV